MRRSCVVGCITAAIVLLATAGPARAYDVDVAARAFGANTLEKPVPVTVLRGWQGDDSAVTEARIERIADSYAWNELWQAHAPGVTAPALDFGKEMALCVFAGEGGARVQIYSVREEDVIEIMTMSFISDMLTPDRPTPYMIAVVPRSLKPVVVVARTMGLMRAPPVQYQMVKELPPLTAGHYLQRGWARMESGDYDRAIVEFDLAVALDANSALAHDGRGQAWQAKGDHERAIADFDEAIRISPNRYHSYNNRCWTIAAAGRDLGLALADCDRALQLAPSDADVLDSRGFLYLRLNRLDEALTDFGAALARNPKLASSLYGQGIARQRNGDTTQGAADLAAAKLIQPDIAELLARDGIKAE